MNNPKLQTQEGNGNLLVIDEEMNKICSRYSRHLKNREGTTRSQVLQTSKKEESVTVTIPAPTRFSRKSKKKGGYQMETLCSQIALIGVHDQPVKFDAPYDSVLLQLMEPDPSDANANAGTYITSESLNIRTSPSARTWETT